MPFCGKCGKKYEDDLNFCPYCGTPNPLYKEDISSGSSDMKRSDEDKTVKRTHLRYGTDLQNLPVGVIVDERYEIREKIGEGGFGTVYKVWDKDIESVKAIKVINSSYYGDKEVIADLKREAKLLMQVDSRNVVKFYDIHLKGSIKYIDMEYINGGDLVDLKLKYKESGKGVPEDKVLEIAKQICIGMQSIHSKNVIHKDIKPQNIMLMKDGTVKIMDFGIAETFRTSKSRIQESQRSGTPAYMSPEQILGENVGKESDVWSFGVMLYELLSGTTLYTGRTTNEVLLQIERKKLAIIDGVTEKTNKIIEKCLKYNYKDRFRNFGEILEIWLKKEESRQKIDEPEKTVKSEMEEKEQAEEIVKKDVVSPIPTTSKKSTLKKENFTKQELNKNNKNEKIQNTSNINSIIFGFIIIIVLFVIGNTELSRYDPTATIGGIVGLIDLIKRAFK